MNCSVICPDAAITVYRKEDPSKQRRKHG
jgi:formate hydrogenlyase subunit 6/NADH:ubiquinone oxidoreductase subunit I